MKIFKVIAVIFGVFFLIIGIASSSINANDIYYARCNLKVLKGGRITWINWQSAPSFVPVGTKLEVTPLGGGNYSLKVLSSGAVYVLDAGADGAPFLEKFVSRSPVKIESFSPLAQASIKIATAKIGMSKIEVYTSLGPPTYILDFTATWVDTKFKTYDDIMKASEWAYKRRRFAKNIGIKFDPHGRVYYTEGIWR